MSRKGPACSLFVGRDLPVVAKSVSRQGWCRPDGCPDVVPFLLTYTSSPFPVNPAAMLDKCFAVGHNAPFGNLHRRFGAAQPGNVRHPQNGRDCEDERRGTRPPAE